MVDYNPFEPGFAADPYPGYRAMREAEPVHQSPLGFWVLFAYDDVLRFLRDPALSVEDANAKPTPLTEMVRQIAGERAERGGKAMLNRDPPDHSRLRKLVTKAFTPRVIEDLRPRIERLVGGMLDDGVRDVISDFAFPLPFAVISEMLGIADGDAKQLREWSGMMVRSLEPLVDTEVINAIGDAADGMYGFVADAIAHKRAHPADDLLSALIAAEEQGDNLSDEELIEQVVLLYIAGHETTVNLIGNGALALIRNRDEMRRLAADPSLMPGAVEELLRYDSPVQMSRRITLEDVAVRDRVIEAGSFVVLGLASSNRDPARFGPDAERLDVTRAGAHQHLSFGGGVHYCLGAALARLEGQVAIGELIRRMPRIELDGEVTWNGRLNLRGIERFPVTAG